MKASQYGLANLKKVVPNLVEWTSRDGYGYEELDEVYRELTGMWRGYISHVIANVGGVYETRKTADQEGVVYTPVPKEKQKAAVDFLNKHAFTTPEWLLDQNILDRIEASGAIERIQSLQTRSLESLLDEARLKRMMENEQVNGKDAYSAIQLMNELRKAIFQELYNARGTDAYRRNLQRSYVDIAADYVQLLKAEKDDNILKSDIIALMRGELEQLRRDLSAKRNSTNDSLTRYHWNDLIARIDLALSVES